MSDTTMVRVTTDQRDELRARKRGGETYADVVERLLEQTEPQTAQAHK